MPVCSSPLFHLLSSHQAACELLEAPVMPSAILFHSQGQIPLPDNMTLLTTALESTTTPLSFFSNALSTLPPPNITLPADLSELSPTDLRKVISTDEYCLVVLFGLLLLHHFHLRQSLTILSLLSRTQGQAPKHCLEFEFVVQDSCASV
ncbi:hypothetical protein BLNAU_24777 [Blattamonas nauphoetae]|uniref:Uncharacterized protein n=1 Tax=Blattamonas nauphoetae TaxID=2049346 RepID=A0ABQ9WLV4_9EUKA|nr:hypothetical protein BLNAU_24777 [Blattamonas nauphoetae]